MGIKLQTILEEIKNLKSLPISERVEAFNEISTTLQEMIGIEDPAIGVQLIPIEKVKANTYNPNKVANPEMKLLEFSIRKDGLTMPVVVCKNGEDSYEVVDGFHRTKIMKTRPDLQERSQGYLPVSLLNKNLDDRITSTVRHNLARGTHQVQLSANLIVMLRKHHWTNERIGKELGMDPDEVLRLKQITGLAEAFADKEFSKSWT